MFTGANYTKEKKISAVRRVVYCICALAAVLLVMSTMKFTIHAQEDRNTASVASESDAKEGIVLDDDGYFRYYSDNKVIKKQGWTDFGSLSVYMDKYGHVTDSYNMKSETYNVYKSGKISLAKNCLEILKDGYSYYFDNSGKKLKKSGWYTQNSNNMYYFSTQNRVTKKFIRSGDKIEIYEFDKASAKWNRRVNKWETINKVKYRLSSSGRCETMYYTDSAKAYTLSGNGKFVLAANSCVNLEDGKTYYFNGSGVKVSKAGWYAAASGTDICAGKSGDVTAKIQKSGETYEMYKYNSANKSWVVQKNQWVETGTKLYYFSNDGKATTIYDLSTRKLYEYSLKTKKCTTVRKAIKKLNGSRYYYYDGQGVRSTSKGWKNGSGLTKFYVGSDGYVTYKYTSKKGVKKLYSYSLKKQKWVSRKSQWKTVSNIKIYFGSKGIASLQYDTKTKKAYTYSKKKWRLVRKSIKKIAGVNYYFNSKGKRVMKAGVYKTSNGYLAYVNRKGTVYKREYDLSVKRYYTISLGNGKKTKVYGYYDLKAANNLIKLVNNHRKANGFSALKVSSSMKETAATRAVEVSNTYSHYRPNGTICINSMYELYGENLACGFKESDLVFRAWNKSSSHNTNMLKTSYRTIGAAVFIALRNDKQGFQRYYVLTFGK